MQKLIRLLYPPGCLLCQAQVNEDGGLCGNCWRDTPFLDASGCAGCGAPLLTDAPHPAALCDGCTDAPPLWTAGRAALAYRDNGRALVLALKHGDREDIASVGAQWMAKAARDLVQPDTVVVPVPLHRTRLLRRRFNQAALLARRLARQLDLPCAVDALIRPRATASLHGQTRAERFETLHDKIVPHPRRQQRLEGRAVLLVDDVMTSGATLRTAAQACLSAQAREVSVVTLARVVNDA